jgi:hypothetical protein
MFLARPGTHTDKPLMRMEWLCPNNQTLMFMEWLNSNADVCWAALPLTSQNLVHHVMPVSANSKAGYLYGMDAHPHIGTA